MKTKGEKNPLKDREVVLVRRLDEIENIRNIWKEMQHNQSSAPHPNTDIDRYLSVLEPMKNVVQPYIMLLRHNHHPEAMLICRKETTPIRCKIGYLTLLKPSLRCISICYGGFLGRTNSEVCSIWLREVNLRLRNGEADVAVFNHLSTDSEMYKLARAKSNVLGRDYFPRVQVHWQTHIPESIESFYKTIPNKHKKEWKRCERRLAEACKGPVEVVCYSNEQEIDHIMEVACGISARTYKHAMNVGIVDDVLTRALLREAARNGWLRAYILYLNSVPCAFEFGIRYGKVFFPQYIGYDPKWRTFGPGALLFLKVIEDLCTDPAIDMLDYGFGDAPYKQRLGTKSWQEASVYIFAPRLYPIFTNILHSSIKGLSLGMSYCTRKIGFQHWVKRRWRNLLQSDSKP
jgi:hypothetical protein